ALRAITYPVLLGRRSRRAADSRTAVAVPRAEMVPVDFANGARRRVLLEISLHGAVAEACAPRNLLRCQPVAPPVVARLPRIVIRLNLAARPHFRLSLGWLNEQYALKSDGVRNMHS